MPNKAIWIAVRDSVYIYMILVITLLNIFSVLLTNTPTNYQLEHSRFFTENYFYYYYYYYYY